MTPKESTVNALAHFVIGNRTNIAEAMVADIAVTRLYVIQSPHGQNLV